VAGIRDRCKALIDAIRVGATTNLPERIGEHLSDPEDWLEEVWNETIVPLLVPLAGDLGISDATPSEFTIFERKLNFVRLVVCHVLDGSVSPC
jgi:hypothetical protein